MEIYRTYNKVKDVFVKPKMNIYFGLNRNSRIDSIFHKRNNRFFGFKIENYDVTWKEKYNEPRFESNPMFSIMFFGLEFSIWLSSPVQNEYSGDMDYWETILSYIYFSNESITETLNECGSWSKEVNGKISYWFQFRRSFLKRDEDKKEYDEARRKYRQEHKNNKIV